MTMGHDFSIPRRRSSIDAQETTPASLPASASERGPQSTSRSRATGFEHLRARVTAFATMAPRNFSALRTSTSDKAAAVATATGAPGFDQEFTADTIAGASGKARADPHVEGMEFPVPDIRQKRINACGDACMHVMLAHHGLPHTDFGTNERSLLIGHYRRELIDALRDRGVQCIHMKPADPRRVSEAELLNWLGRHGPLLAETSDHFVVVTGVRAGRVIIHCPLLGRRTGSIAALNKYLGWSEGTSPLLRTLPIPRGSDDTEETEARDVTPRLPGRAERAATRVLAKIELASTWKWKSEKG
jgi:hypothetical protein